MPLLLTLLLLLPLLLFPLLVRNLSMKTAKINVLILISVLGPKVFVSLQIQIVEKNAVVCPCKSKKPAQFVSEKSIQVKTKINISAACCIITEVYLWFLDVGALCCWLVVTAVSGCSSAG